MFSTDMQHLIKVCDFVYFYRSTKGLCVVTVSNTHFKRREKVKSA